MTRDTILLVEDYPLNQKLCLAILDILEIPTLLAANGLEAVLQFEQHHDKIGLIFMDIKMPEMNGLVATHHIRALPYGKEVPILALTANAMGGDRETCLDAGMNDYLTKPLTRQDLEEKIREYMPLDTKKKSNNHSAA